MAQSTAHTLPGHARLDADGDAQRVHDEHLAKGFHVECADVVARRVGRGDRPHPALQVLHALAPRFGARYTWRFNDRWGMTVRGDGSFDDTEGTWNASVVGQYRTQHGVWAFGYRDLDVSLEPDTHRLDITVEGFMVGCGFRF